MDPDLLDRQMDDLLSGASKGTLPTAVDSWFDEYEAWLAAIPAVADATPAANIVDEDEVMADAGLTPHWGSCRDAPPSDTDDDSVTDEEPPFSDFFVPAGLRASGMDQEMASLDLVGSEVPDTEVEFLTAAFAQLALTSVEDIIIIQEQQRSLEDVDMVELQKPIPPVIVFDMTEPEEPTDNATELNRPIPPVFEMTEPEEPTPTVVDTAELNGSISHVVEMAEPEEPTPPRRRHRSGCRSKFTQADRIVPAIALHG
ncbi:hypothetical protein FP744_10006898 [Trichoderma asperellum]